MDESKRSRQESKEEQKPKLGLDEMIPIFWRLPTSELIKFISNAPNHPLGKFWSGGLKFVVERRLPFSLKATVAMGNNGRMSTKHIICDCNGLKVADIKHPERFHLSPLCALVEEVELPLRFYGLSGLRTLPHRLNLDAFVNINILNLSFWQNPLRLRSISVGSSVGTELAPELMSRLQTISLSADHSSGLTNDVLAELSERLVQANSLRKLSVTARQFIALMARSCPWAPLTNSPDDVSSLLWRLFLDLDSLVVARGPVGDLSIWSWILDLMRTRCTNLTELDLPLRGAIREYFTAFEALPHLARLGLDTLNNNRVDLAVDANVAAVTSVIDFRLALNRHANDLNALLVMLSKLPLLRAFEIQTLASDFMLRFAYAVCSREILRNLQTLKCSRNVGSVSCGDILQFLCADNANFPATVDLSQMQLPLAPCGREFLVDLCRAIERNGIMKFSICAIVHQDSLDRLREHFSSESKNKFDQGASAGKVLAWKSGEVRGIQPNSTPQFTDFRIEGIKTSGPAKGAGFLIRVYFR